MKYAAILLSGGSGSRVGGDIPKQYIEVGGAPVIRYSLQSLLSDEDMEGLCVVCDEGWRSLINEETRAFSSDAPVFFAAPGRVRQESIYNGLSVLRLEGFGRDTRVLVCDAARPNLTAEMIKACVEGLDDHDGVMPVLPMKDTIYVSSDGKTISGLLDRSTLFAGQAPEAFWLGSYLKANEKLLPDDILSVNGASEVAVKAGLDVAMIQGDEHNYKITTPADMDRFREQVEGK